MRTITTLAVFLLSLSASAQCWQSLRTGSLHTIALSIDGTLWAWGSNGNGQLGIGTNQDQNVPVQIGTENNWVYISSFSEHSAAIKSDGTLWTWGKNDSGQLGDGTDEWRTAPVQVGNDNNWVSVACGSYHTLAIKSDGTLWAWGNNNYVQLGIGNYFSVSSPVQVGTDTNWKSVAAGEFFTLGLKFDGSLWAWGTNGNGVFGNGQTPNFGEEGYHVMAPVPVGAGNDWVFIAAGTSYAGGIKADGSLWSWGYNSEGQLGIGTTTDVAVPTLVDEGNWSSVSFSSSLFYYFGGGIKQDGSLWTWGSNFYGSFGNGSTNNSLIPVNLVSEEVWSEFSAGSVFSAAIAKNDVIYTWGWNTLGELGNGTNTNSTIPVMVSCHELNINSNHYLAFKVFPNPVQDILNVITPALNQPVTFKVFNVSGVKIIEESATPLKVDILESGVYFLEISVSDTAQVIKFIKS